MSKKATVSSRTPGVEAMGAIPTYWLGISIERQAVPGEEKSCVSILPFA